jgi:hypothetical protein
MSTTVVGGSFAILSSKVNRFNTSLGGHMSINFTRRRPNLDGGRVSGRFQRDSWGMIVFLFHLTVEDAPGETVQFLHHALFTLPADPLRYLDLDLRRLARPALQEAVRQEHVCQRMPGGVLPVSVPGRATLQDRRKRFDILQTPHHKPTSALSQPNPRRL